MLTDADRKVLETFMGFERIKPGHGSCCTCQHCGHHYDDCWCTDWDTPADLYAVYSKLVERGEWEDF